MIARPCLCRLILPRPYVPPVLSLATCRRRQSTVNDLPESRLNPQPDDYSAPRFADRAELTLYAGPGGSGCISFLREAFLSDGPPNGGDGGSGGNIYIVAVPAETSLHKLSRQTFMRAGRGKSGQGKGKGGAKGDDVVLTVPVGTVVREVSRQDPAADEAARVREWIKARKAERRAAQQAAEEERRAAREAAENGVDGQPEGEEENTEEAYDPEQDAEEEEDVDEGEDVGEEDDGKRRRGYRHSRRHLRWLRNAPPLKEPVPEPEPETFDDDPQRHKWLLHPSMSKTDVNNFVFPEFPRRSRLQVQPPAPIHLDLSRPSTQPILLALGGAGGLGNSHFTSREHPRPLFATRGDPATTLRIELELKLLADVGLVGLPNAGKSTLLRAMTGSRTRIGSWAFTTLKPNIGTVVLDRYSGHTALHHRTRRPRFSVADIPGLIQGAHLDRGLGIAFLRHVERAAVLAFVIDLSAGDAVAALTDLWREVGLYAQMRDEEDRARLGDEADRKLQLQLQEDQDEVETYAPIDLTAVDEGPALPPALYIAGKPWFVVATKADLPDTQANFARLKAHLDAVSAGIVPHPSGVEGCWTKSIAAIPVSAINAQGIEPIVDWIAGLLDE